MATPFAQKQRLPDHSRPTEPLKKCDPRLWSNGSTLCDKFLVYRKCSRENCPYEHRERTKAHRDVPPFCFNHYGLKGGCTRTPICPLVHGQHEIPNKIGARMLRKVWANSTISDSSDDEDGGTVVDVEVRAGATRIPQARYGRLRAASGANWSGTPVFEEETVECTSIVEDTVGSGTRKARSAKSTENRAAVASESCRDGSSTASVSQRPRTKTAPSPETLRPELPLYSPPARRRSSHHNARPAALSFPSPEQEGPSVYYPDSLRSNSPTEGRRGPRRKRPEIKNEPKDKLTVPGKAVEEPVKGKPRAEVEQLPKQPNQSKLRRLEKAAKNSAVPVEAEQIQTVKQPPDPKNTRQRIFGPVAEDAVKDASGAAKVEGDKLNGAPPIEKQKRQKSKPAPVDTVSGMSSTEKVNTRRGKEKIETFIQTNGVSIGVKVGEFVNEQVQQMQYVVSNPPQSTNHSPKVNPRTTNSIETSSTFHQASSPPPPPLSHTVTSPSLLLSPLPSPSLSTHVHHAPTPQTLLLQPLAIAPFGYSIAQPPLLTSPRLPSHPPPAPASVTVKSELSDNVAFAKQFEEVHLTRQKLLLHTKSSAAVDDTRQKTSPEAFPQSPADDSLRPNVLSLQSQVFNDCAGLDCCRPPDSTMPHQLPPRGPRNQMANHTSISNMLATFKSAPQAPSWTPVGPSPADTSMDFNPHTHPAMIDWFKKFCFNCWEPWHLPQDCSHHWNNTILRENKRWEKGILTASWTNVAKNGFMVLNTDAGNNARVIQDHLALWQVMMDRRRISRAEFHKLLDRLANEWAPQHREWVALTPPLLPAMTIEAPSRFLTPSTQSGGAPLSPPDSRSTTPSYFDNDKTNSSGTPSPPASNTSRSQSPQQSPRSPLTPVRDHRGKKPMTPESDEEKRLPCPLDLIPYAGDKVKPKPTSSRDEPCCWCRETGHKPQDCSKTTLTKSGYALSLGSQLLSPSPLEPESSPPPVSPELLKTQRNFPHLRTQEPTGPVEIIQSVPISPTPPAKASGSRSQNAMAIRQPEPRRSRGNALSDYAGFAPKMSLFSCFELMRNRFYCVPSDIRRTRANLAPFWQPKELLEGETVKTKLPTEGKKVKDLPDLPAELIMMIMEQMVVDLHQDFSKQLVFFHQRSEEKVTDTARAREIFDDEYSNTPFYQAGKHVGRYNREVFKNLNWAAKRPKAGQSLVRLQYKVVSIGLVYNLQCFAETVSRDPQLAEMVRVLNINLYQETKSSIQDPILQVPPESIIIRRNGKKLRGYYNPALVGDAIATILQCCTELRHVHIRAGGAIQGIAGLDVDSFHPKELKNIFIDDAFSYGWVLPQFYKVLCHAPSLIDVEISHCTGTGTRPVMWPRLRIPESLAGEHYAFMPQKLRHLSLTCSAEISDENWIGIAPFLKKLKSVKFDRCQLVTASGFLKGLNLLPKYPQKLAYLELEVSRYTLEKVAPFDSIPHLCEQWKAALCHPRLLEAELRITRMCKKFWTDAEFANLQKLEITGDDFFLCGLKFTQVTLPAHYQGRLEWVEEWRRMWRDGGERFRCLKEGGAVFSHELEIDFGREWRRRYGD